MVDAQDGTHQADPQGIETRRSEGAITELWPTPGPIADPFGSNFALDRSKDDGTPWVAMVMISTLDGGAELDGLSGGLGAPSDKDVFGAMRSIADVIVVAGGTARAENYGPPVRRERVLDARRERAQADVARLAVLSASLDFDPGARLFESAEGVLWPLLYTVPSDDATHKSRRSSLETSAELVTLDEVTPETVLSDLAARGCSQIVLEGGPSLNGQFLAADLVDEIHLSLAPIAIGGDALRIIRGGSPAAGGGPDPRRFELARLWMGDGILFCSYHRIRA